MGAQRVEPEQDDPGGTAITAPGFALGVGAVAALVSLWALNPLLVNTYGPFGEHATLGLLAAVAASLALAVGVGLLTLVVAKRSALGLVALVAGLAAVAVLAFPTPVDRHESFVEQPNERSSCRGLSFRHYPPGTMDAASVTYCVGFEHHLPTG